MPERGAHSFAFFFQAEDGIRDDLVTGVQTCALPISMTYNELAQVLEPTNPKTGKLYQPSELNVIKRDDAGTGMLEDGVFVRGDWIKDSKNQETAKRVLAASLRGWIYGRSPVTE